MSFLFRYGRDYYINQSGELQTKRKQVSVHNINNLEKSILYGTLPRTMFRNQKGTQNFVKNPIYFEDI